MVVLGEISQASCGVYHPGGSGLSLGFVCEISARPRAGVAEW